VRSCTYIAGKTTIDWDARSAELRRLAKSHHNPNGYDCVIPVSGGKDSTFQVLKALEYGFHPLAVCFETTLPTEIGEQNLDALRNLGVDLIHVKANPKTSKRLTKYTFENFGVGQWALFLGAYVMPTRIAIQMGIRLIIWGETVGEYGASDEDSQYSGVDVYQVEKGGFGLVGITFDDLINSGFSEMEIALYKWPSRDTIRDSKLRAIHLGHFVDWNQREIVKLLAQHGWHPNPTTTGSSYTGYNGIDCDALEVHDYLKYVKFGYGRATDEACLDIRHGRISREEGLRLVERHDSTVPHAAIARFAEYIGVSGAEAMATIYRFTNDNIFETNADGSPTKDIDGVLVRKNESTS
jgi:N-acetyl sugar amidotransferase